MLYFYKCQKMEYCWSCPILTFQLWESLKLFMQSCRGTLSSLFPTESILQIYHYSYGKWSDELYSIGSPLQIFTARIQHAMFTESNHQHFLYILFLRSKFHSALQFLSPSYFSVSSTQTAFCQELLLCGTKSHMDASRNTTILMSSYQGSITIFPQYPHNLYFLLSPLTYILHTLFSNHQPWVALEPCIVVYLV